MKLVGMTYDLRTDYLQEGYSEEQTAEFDQPATIDAIEETLISLGTGPTGSATCEPWRSDSSPAIAGIASSTSQKG